MIERSWVSEWPVKPPPRTQGRLAPPKPATLLPSICVCATSGYAHRSEILASLLFGDQELVSAWMAGLLTENGDLASV